jgi:hypothetical protein
MYLIFIVFVALMQTVLLKLPVVYKRLSRLSGRIADVNCHDTCNLKCIYEYVILDILKIEIFNRLECIYCLTHLWWIYIQGVTGGVCETSGECSLC